MAGKLCVLLASMFANKLSKASPIYNVAFPEENGIPVTRSLYPESTESIHPTFYIPWINKKYLEQNNKSKQYTFAEGNNDLENISRTVKSTLKPAQGTNQPNLLRYIRTTLGAQVTQKNRFQRCNIHELYEPEDLDSTVQDIKELAKDVDNYGLIRSANSVVPIFPFTDTLGNYK